MSPRVLVVTTRTAFAEPLSVALRASDLDYVGARTLDSAYELVGSDVGSEELPSAVVLDVMSIDGDLAALCDVVRARDQGGSVPIIFCGSGAESVKSTSDALIAGGDGYFALPIAAQKVVAKLATYIGCPVPDLPADLMLPGNEAPAEPASDPVKLREQPDTQQPLDDPTPVPRASDERAADESDPQPPSEMLDVTSPMMRPAAVSGLPRDRTDEGATVSDAPMSASAAGHDDPTGVVRTIASAEEEEEEARRAIAEASAAALKEAEQREQKLAEAHAKAAAEREAEMARLREAAEQEGRRVDEERARLEQLEQQRQVAEAEAQAALAEAKEREREERERLRELAEQRQAAEQDAERARADAQQREREERERIEALEQARKSAEADAQRALEAAQQQEAVERARLDELEHARAVAEENMQRAMEESAQREIEARHALDELEQKKSAEEQQLHALLALRTAAEADAQRSLDDVAHRAEEAKRTLDETEKRAEQERARLKTLEDGRRRAESEAAQTAAEAMAREAQLTAAIDDLERHRRALEEEARRKEEENRRRATDELERLSKLDAERRVLEEQARKDDDERRRRAEHEERELRALTDKRTRAEAELREKVDERMQALALEEKRLAEVRAAREQAARDELDAVGRREREAQEAQLLLEEARKQRAQIEAEAQVELERLRQMREEEELARRELEEKRARARLAFSAGRLDALPAGERLAGAELGNTLRPVTDAQGNVLGGGLLPIIPQETEPPAPLPFVALDPVQGRFGDGELAGLLWSAHGLKVTGAIELKSDEGHVRTLYLEQGEPVLVASDLSVDRPEEGLLRAGLVTAAQYNALRAGPLRSPRRTAAALVQDGVLKVEEMFPAVRGVLVEQVLALLEWESGTFSYREERAHAADRVRLEHGFGALLAEAIRRKLDERRLWRVLGGPATIVAPDDRGRPLPPLSPEEKLVLARLDGTRAMEDVIIETAISAAVVLRAALIAISCGAARVLARGVPADPNERMVQRDRSVAIDRARVMDRLQAARHGDYFTFLGIDVHASPFEVQRAAERVRQRYDAARFSDPAFGDLRAALDEIRDISMDAEAVLADEALADGYRRSLSTQRPNVRKLVG